MAEALVCSGGGAHGAVECGVLQVLAEQGYDPDVECGISTGGLSVAATAQFPKGQFKEGVALLTEIYGSLKKNSDVYTEHLLGKIGLAEADLVLHPSMYLTGPIAKLINTHVDPAKLKASGRLFRCGSVCLETGGFRTFTELDKDVLAGILASASMPVYLNPVRMLRTPVSSLHGLFVDGGLTHQTPTAEAFRALRAFGAGPHRMTIILCNTIAPLPLDSSQFKNGFDILTRLIDILIHNIFINDLQTACDVNNIPRPGKQYVELRLFMPTQLAGDTLEFNQADIRANIAHGRERALVPLDQPAIEAALKSARMAA